MNSLFGETLLQGRDPAAPERAIHRDVVDVHGNTLWLHPLHYLMHDALEYRPGCFHSKQKNLPLVKPVVPRERRHWLQVRVQQQLMIYLYKIQGDKYSQSYHLFKLVINSMH